MFIDVVTSPKSEIELVDEQTGLFSDPPDGLVAAIAWESDDEQVTTVMVWDAAGARGDFAFQKMMPLMEQQALTSNPDIVTPHKVFIRGEA